MKLKDSHVVLVILVCGALIALLTTNVISDPSVVRFSDFIVRLITIIIISSLGYALAKGKTQKLDPAAKQNKINIAFKVIIFILLLYGLSSWAWLYNKQQTDLSYQDQTLLSKKSNTDPQTTKIELPQELQQQIEDRNKISDKLVKLYKNLGSIETLDWENTSSIQNQIDVLNSIVEIDNEIRELSQKIIEGKLNFIKKYINKESTESFIEKAKEQQKILYLYDTALMELDMSQIKIFKFINENPDFSTKGDLKFYYEVPEKQEQLNNYVIDMKEYASQVRKYMDMSKKHENEMLDEFGLSI